MSHPRPQPRLLCRFLRDREGATIVEFAVVASLFFTMMMGMVEYGLFMMTQVAIEGAVLKASRAGSISVGGDRIGAVTKEIRDRSAGIINANLVVVTANKVAAGGASPTPDICLSTPPRLGGACNPPLQWQEANGVPGYQAGGGTNNGGGSGDLVEIRASYPWTVHFPLIGQFFGRNGVILISSSTIVRNEND